MVTNENSKFQMEKVEKIKDKIEENKEKRVSN